MRSKIGLFFLIISIVVMSSGVSFAVTANWYTCNVLQVGSVNSTSRYAYLTDTAATPAFVNQPFKLADPTMANEQIATLLTAVSSDKTIWAYINANNQIVYIYIKR